MPMAVDQLSLTDLNLKLNFKLNFNLNLRILDFNADGC
jgi:hypothetical protein